MILVHLWIPKAHVQVSVSDSMILAGIILKLGGYGLPRLLILYVKILLKGKCYLVIFRCLVVVTLWCCYHICYGRVMLNL